MKRTIWKTLAVIAIFSIGASINSSCGASHSNENTPPPGEIWDTVNDLVAEVSQLKKDNELLKEEIRQLRENNGGTGSNGGDRLIDGLYFDRKGKVISNIKKYWTDDYEYECTYEYDEKGRMQTQTVFSSREIDGSTYTGTTTYKYNYSGKMVTTTSTTVFSSPEIEESTTTDLTEYY